jgi:hypothetical protein
MPTFEQAHFICLEQGTWSSDLAAFFHQVIATASRNALQNGAHFGIGNFPKPQN